MMKTKFLSGRFLALLTAVSLTAGLTACTAKTDGPGTSDPASGPVTENLPETGSEDAASPELSASGEALIRDVDLSTYTPLASSENSRIFYHIFVGSFSDSDGDGVGDLRGVINRLDYLNDGDPASGASLGVEGIWLSPIFKSPSYHKYDTTDYYTIDPEFGTMEDLKELAQLCEERNVKLILDMVINHSGSHNEWFLNFVHAHQNADPSDPWYDFYTWNTTGSEKGRTFSKISKTEDYYECNFSTDMPEFNYENPAVYDKILEVAKYYLEDIGVDGFRFDAAKYVYFKEDARSAEFWKQFMADLKAINPDIFTVAEVWDSDSITSVYTPAIDCFDFTMAQVDGLISATTKKGDVNGYTSYIEYYLKNNRAQRADMNLVSFIANHDTDRAAGYMTYASGYAKMAASLYLLNPGSSFIYYGEEIGMKGSRGSANTDANRRLAMLWGDGDTVKDPKGATFETASQTNGTVAEHLGNPDSLLNHYKRLILIRKANPEIASGEYHALGLEGTKAGGFVSVKDGKAVAVFHNTGGSSASIDLSTLKFTDGSSISTLLDPASVQLTYFIDSSMTGENSEATLEGTVLTLPSQSSVVIR